MVLVRSGSKTLVYQFIGLNSLVSRFISFWLTFLSHNGSKDLRAHKRFIYKGFSSVWLLKEILPLGFSFMFFLPLTPINEM